MESVASVAPMDVIKPYTVINFTKCNINHIAFAIAAFIIMTITILLLKMIATANMFSALKIATPAYYFFGDARTMNRYVSSFKETFTTERDYTPIADPAIPPADPAIPPATSSPPLMKYMDLLYDQFIVPVVYKYGAM